MFPQWGIEISLDLVGLNAAIYRPFELVAVLVGRSFWYMYGRGCGRDYGTSTSTGMDTKEFSYRRKSYVHRSESVV